VFGGINERALRHCLLTVGERWWYVLFICYHAMSLIVN